MLHLRKCHANTDTNTNNICTKNDLPLSPLWLGDIKTLIYFSKHVVSSFLKGMAKKNIELFLGHRRICFKKKNAFPIS